MCNWYTMDKERQVLSSTESNTEISTEKSVAVILESLWNTIGRARWEGIEKGHTRQRKDHM